MTSNSARATRAISMPPSKYLKEVGRVLGPLQITHGGPIIMVQVENEYGFYGKDSQYMEEIRKSLLDAGFDVPLFECNPPDMMRNGMEHQFFSSGKFRQRPRRTISPRSANCSRPAR